jgi:hypothetical protein
MKFVCVLCERAVSVGEPMLPNESGEVAHQSCVESRSEIRMAPPGNGTVTVSLPSVTVPFPKVDPTPTSCSAPYPSTSAPPPPKACVVCRKPCIGACPACGALVCQTYGYERSCGVTHEGDCSGARASREPRTKPSVLKDRNPIYDTVDVPIHRNGRHARAERPKKRKR